MKNAPTLTRNSTFNCSDYISHLEKKYLLNDEVNFFKCNLILKEQALNKKIIHRKSGI